MKYERILPADYKLRILNNLQRNLDEIEERKKNDADYDRWMVGYTHLTQNISDTIETLSSQVSGGGRGSPGRRRRSRSRSRSRSRGSGDVSD